MDGGEEKNIDVLEYKCCFTTKKSAPTKTKYSAIPSLSLTHRHSVSLSVSLSLSLSLSLFVSRSL